VRRVHYAWVVAATTFLIVTSPRHDPVQEAIYFHRKLREAGMPFGGVVVNRMHEAAPPDARLPEELGGGLAARVLTSARELAALAEREEANVAHLRAELGDPPILVVPELEDDVHDLEGLELMGDYLFA